jgi:hypothetical protein
MKPSLIAQIMCCVLALGGCGGATSPPNTAEGFWVGTANTGAGDTAALVDLQVGQFFAMVTNPAGNVIKEGLFGSLVGTDSTLSGGSGTDYNFTAHTMSSITSTGTVSAKSAITASTSTGVTVTAAYRPSYDQVPDMSTIAHTYSGYGVAAVAGSTEPIPVSIGLDGTTTVGGTSCTGTGTTIPKPNANGKNVFTITITFATGTGCLLGDGATTYGILILDQNVTPARAYIMSVINDSSNAFYWTGTATN